MFCLPILDKSAIWAETVQRFAQANKNKKHLGSTMDRRKIDVTLSTFLIIVAVIILTNDNLVQGGAESDLGSMFLPRVAAGLIIIFAATIAIQSLRKIVLGSKPEGQEVIITDGFFGIFITKTSNVLGNSTSKEFYILRQVADMRTESIPIPQTDICTI